MNSVKIEVLDNEDSLLELIVDGYLRREPGKVSKDIDLLKSLNTEAALFRYLNTNPKSGTLDRIASQKRWGLNALPKREMTPFCRLVWDAGSDPMLRILMIAGIASLVLGVLFGKSPGVEWIEGAAIFLAVWIVVFVTAINDFMKEKQFENLYLQEHKFCSVIRDGEIQTLDFETLVVGDVVQIEAGDQIPADCLLIYHHNIQIDESSITGESELIHKTPLSDIFKATGGSTQKDIPSSVILSGSVVSSGFGRCVVIGVGLRSQVGKLFIKLAVDTEPTPLQNKLNGLARDVGKIGFVAALLTLVALNVTYWTLYLLGDRSASASEIASTMVEYLVTSITIIVVAVPEGLPLAVTIALAFSVNRMLKDQNYVRRLASCETMGGANEICSDKTGTLTRNQMEVETYWNGSTFDQSLPENYLEILAQNISLNSTAYLEFINPEPTQRPEEPVAKSPHVAAVNDSDLQQSEGVFGHYKQIGSPTECALLLFLLRQKSIDYSTLRKELSANVVISIPFDSSRKSMTTILDIKAAEDSSGKAAEDSSGKAAEDSSGKAAEDSSGKAAEDSSCDLKSADRSLLDPTPRSSRTYRLLVKGAAELVLRRCEYRVDSSGNLKRFDLSKFSKVESNVIEHMSSEGLRTVCLAYRDFDPSRFPDWDQEDENGILKIESNLICLGIAGIRDPVRAEVPGAVRKCQSAGIRVRMCTGDNIETAKQIGIKACIYHPERGGLAMLGSDFLKAVGGVVCSECNTAKCPCENKSPYTFCESNEAESVEGNCCCWSSKADNFPLNSPDKKRVDVLGNPEEFEKIIERLEILARSQPTDKYALVTGLKNRGAIVAVTGDGVNDAPALKKADIGFAMGITGKEVAKQAADIVLLDDNFESIVRAVKWGRNIYDNIQKFLQFQLTVNAVAVLTAFVGAVVLRGSPLTAVQLLWINLIMDSFAALALATEKPTDDVLHRPPHSRSEYLVNKRMFRNILGQVVYQVSVMMCVIFTGECWLPEFESHNLRNLDRFPEFSQFSKTCGNGATVRSGRAFFPGTGIQDYKTDWTVFITPSRHYTYVFNIFVFMQIFNLINARKITEFGIFTGIFSNYYWLVILFGILGTQIILVTFGGFALNSHVDGLTWQQWAICVLLGAGTLVVGFLIKLLPSKIVDVLPEAGIKEVNPLDEPTSVAMASRGRRYDELSFEHKATFKRNWSVRDDHQPLRPGRLVIALGGLIPHSPLPLTDRTRRPHTPFHRSAEEFRIPLLKPASHF